MPALQTRGTRDDAAPAKPRSDAYVGLLLIALLAQLAGILFLYLDWSEYEGKAPPKTAPVNLAAPGAPAGAPQAPQQGAVPGGVQPGAPGLGAPPVPARQQPAVPPSSPPPKQ